MSKSNIHPNSIKLLSENNVKKYVLPYYNLQESEISQIKLKDTDKQRAVYKIQNQSKTYCLKKVYYPAGKLLFVYSAVEWWHRNGINVPRILPTINGSRFVNYKNMLFILTPWIEGSKCNYDNEQNFLASGSNLGKMHSVSKNFTPITGSTYKKNFNILHYSINKHFQGILTYSNLAFNLKDEFSKIFLSNFNDCLKLAKNSSGLASTINNQNLTRSLCHLDYVNKNILFDKENNIWVIDFDNSRMDYSSHDAAYSLRRALKRDKTNWDFELALKWINLYNEFHPMTLDDYKYLLSYLAFPQRYWKISRDYYRNIQKCNKKSFCTIIKKSVSNNNNQLLFVETFKRYIEEKFDIKLY